MQTVFIVFLSVIIGSIISSFISVYCIHLYIDRRKRKKEQTHSLDIVILIHHEINEIIVEMLNELHADRILLFQTENGRYFLGGMPMMKLVPTNETTRNLERFKDTKEEIRATDFEESLYILKRESILTLSASNNYEGLVDSRIKLYQRGVKSGIFLTLKKSIFGIEKITAILCIEYRDENPLFTQEQILSICGVKIQKMKALINQKVDIKLEI